MTKAGTFWLCTFIASGIATFILFKIHANIIFSFVLEMLTVVFLIIYLVTDKRKKKPEMIANPTINSNNLNKKEVKQ